jgi:hypothetical protein
MQWKWAMGNGWAQWISGSAVDGAPGAAPTEELRPDASNARSEQPAPERGQLAGVSRALACVLNTRGCPQVFYTAPVIHPACAGA